MGMEYLALVDAASKLGTYQLNRNAPPLSQVNSKTTSRKLFLSSGINNADVEDVREEAKLLWKFATSSLPEEEMKEDEPISNHAPISPSFSFEAKRRFRSKPSCVQIKNEETNLQAPPGQTNNNQNLQGQLYSITFPSLSLDNLSQSNVSISTESEKMTPGKLFSQPITAEQNPSSKLPAETIANNFMQSFLKALDWRSKVWVKALSNYLRNEYQMKTDPRKGEEPIKNEFLKAEILGSNEARVLEAIIHAASSVVVHDIRTTFQVLEKQLDRTSSQPDEESGHLNHSRPPPKKRKMNRLTESPYRLRHAINLETRCTISTKCKKSSDGLKHMTVVFDSSGVIDGTFCRSYDGDIKLVNVNVVLDTQELALAMEKNSRFVIRSAAYNNLLDPPNTKHLNSFATSNTHGIMSDSNSETMEYETEHQEENDEAAKSNPIVLSQSYTAPATPFRADKDTSYPESTMVTPMMGHISRSSSDSEDMPPPAPRLPFGDDHTNRCESVGCKLNPRRVSPPVGFLTAQNDEIVDKLSDPFASPIPSTSLEKLTFGSFGQSSNVITPRNASPFLISPHTPCDEKQINQGFLSPRVAPSLPALLEVARAAHEDCI